MLALLALLPAFTLVSASPAALSGLAHPAHLVSRALVEARQSDTSSCSTCLDFSNAVTTCTGSDPSSATQAAVACICSDTTFSPLQTCLTCLGDNVPGSLTSSIQQLTSTCQAAGFSVPDVTGSSSASGSGGSVASSAIASASASRSAAGGGIAASVSSQVVGAASSVIAGASSSGAAAFSSATARASSVVGSVTGAAASASASATRAAGAGEKRVVVGGGVVAALVGVVGGAMLL